MRAVAAATLVALLVTAAYASAAGRPAPCAAADALAAASETTAARAAYDRLLLKNPNETCASTGLKALNAPKAKPVADRASDWLAPWLRLAAFGALALIIAV